MPILQGGTALGKKIFGGAGQFDTGLSEALGSLGTKLFGAPNQAVLQGGAAFYTPPSQPQVLDQSTSSNTPSVNNNQYNQPAGPAYNGRASGGVGNTGGTGQAAAPAGQNTLYNNIGNQLNSGLSGIDSDYQNYLSTIDTQQSNLQRSAEDANRSIDVASESARNALTKQQADANLSYDTQSQTANKQAGQSLQQARDLYRQLQQQNIAQLSGLGVSSSSVAEALAENLGVETARRIAGVTGSRDEVLNNIAKEKTNTELYVKNKMSELEKQIEQQKASIKTDLLNQINVLNNSRNVAANDRATRRQQLMAQASDQVAKLVADAQTFSQSLEKWKVQNQERLDKTIVSFDDLNKVRQAVGELSGANMNIAGYGASTEGPGAYYFNQTQRQKDPNEFDYSQYGL